MEKKPEKEKKKRDRRGPPKTRPVTAAYLERAALHYLGRFSSCEANLKQVLVRKIKRRTLGAEATDEQLTWIDAVTAKCVAYGYVDDKLYARQRLEALRRRGKTLRHCEQDLRFKGIEADIISDLFTEICELAEEEGAEEGRQHLDWQAAVSYARRRRLGPYQMAGRPLKEDRKQIDAMLRAGFPYDTACKIIAAKNVDEIEIP